METWVKEELFLQYNVIFLENNETKLVIEKAEINNLIINYGIKNEF